jgi:enoyl-CoA hydratase/carnithine racemase
MAELTMPDTAGPGYPQGGIEMGKSVKTYNTILLELNKGVYNVVLNRPDKLNALNEDMCHELSDAFSLVGKDDAARVLVLSGNGRAFSAGGDMGGLFLKMIEDRRAGKKPFDIPTWLSEASLALHSLSIPTIAAINGAAIGFGVTVCLQCDMRIAADNAVMGLPFVKLGLIPEFGCTYTLTRIVGIAKAFELVYTGKNIKADEAKEIGLVNMIVPLVELATATQSLAANIAEGAPMAVKRAKEALYAGLDSGLKQQLKLESKGMNETLISEDHEEAVRTFLAKRPPAFKGR